MKSFKQFIKKPAKKKLPTFQTVDFRDKKKLPTFQTVDFRDKKSKIDEAFKIKSEKYYHRLHDTDQTKGIHTKLREAHGGPLDEHTKTAIQNYTAAEHYGGHSKIINSGLHRSEGKLHDSYKHVTTINDKKETTNPVSHTIEHLDKHLKSHPAPEDHHVYSGLHTHDLKDGHTYKHHGYMSSSIEPDVAADFGKKDKDGYHHILKLKIKKGSKHGAYIQPHSHIKTEKEFLIGRGKNVKITHHEKIEKASDGVRGGVKYIIHHGEIVK